MINVMIVGLPGDMASIVARFLLADDRFNVIRSSMTGPYVIDVVTEIDGVVFELFFPQHHKDMLVKISSEYKNLIVVDYTAPSAAYENVKLYCEIGIPFIMGTTGADYKALYELVRQSNISAVISPNMSKQIVGIQAMMEYAAKTFPGVFKDHSLEIVESHQNGKKDTSGTAKAMVTYFNQLGILFNDDQIQKIRDPLVQAGFVPQQYISGHAWHKYSVSSDRDNVTIKIQHVVNGRDTYALGTIDALLFLNEKLKRRVKKGKVFSMIDVIKSL